MGKTITEKILAKCSGKKDVSPGEFIFAKPDIAVCVDYSTPTFVKALEDIGVKQIQHPKRIVVVIDHRVPAPDTRSAELHKIVREFVRKQGISYFYDVGRGGISHQLMAETGHVRPGMLYVADDTYATTLGGLGAFATNVYLGMIEIFVTGRIWLKVPPSLKFDVSGELSRGVMSRDVLQYILGDIGRDGALYKTMEFSGPTIKDMSIDGRMTICNMVVHAGAKAGIVGCDHKMLDYVKQRTEESFEPVVSDSDAEYDEEFDYDVSRLEPMLAVPSSPVNTKAVVELEGTEIDQAFIGSCAGGRLEDLRVAAKILKNRKISSSTRMIVIPASQEIYMKACREGLLETFVEANCLVCNPGCGPCAGRHMGVLADDEVCVSGSTLNIVGRMGSTKAKIYLASSATIAASAVEGRIVDPRRFL